MSRGVWLYPQSCFAIIFFFFPILCKSGYVFELESCTVTTNGRVDGSKLFLYPNECPKVLSGIFWKYRNSFCPAGVDGQVEVTHFASEASSQSKSASRVENSFSTCEGSPPTNFECEGSKLTKQMFDGTKSVAETEVEQSRKVVVTIPQLGMTATALVVGHSHVSKVDCQAWQVFAAQEAAEELCEKTDFTRVIVGGSPAFLKILPQGNEWSFSGYTNEAEIHLETNLTLGRIILVIKNIFLFTIKFL